MTSRGSLILASTSRYRSELLARWGVPFRAVAPDYEEKNDPGRSPRDLVEEQARGKAESLAKQFPEDWIIGSDQVAHVGGEILNKPGTFQRAREQLAGLAGREHQLVTAVAVLQPKTGRWAEETVVSPIRIRSLTDAEIDRYLELDQPFDCAGSYKAESRGSMIFDFQRGDDPNAVIGLPLIVLARLLRQLDFDGLALAEAEG